MQFSYIDNEVLKKQAEPEKYRDLIVRVAGYSAYFVELCKEFRTKLSAYRHRRFLVKP